MTMIIKYPNGRMTVELDAFFPATQQDMKKLKDVIRMSNCQEAHMKEIITWLDENLKEMKYYAEHCSEQVAKHKEAMDKGLPGTEQYRRHETFWRFFRRESQKADRLIERLKKNQEYMRKEI